MENLKNINVTGEISLRPYEFGYYTSTGERFVVLILGPTGAGKSSFVEALAGSSQKLSLSSDQLAGYTQHINAFQLVNANVRGGTLYVVDTPGFSDKKFSEKEILDMVKAWLDREILPMVRILYLVPINVTRLPGTKRKTLQMLKTFLESSGGRRLTHLTSAGGPSRGQSNFEQLRDNHLKDFIYDGAKIVKFSNTPLSAIQILDASLVYSLNTDFSSLDFRTPQLYRDLYERIENALLEKRNIEDDLAQPDAQTNLNLRNVLEKHQHENEEILTKFISQFREYGEPPEGFEDAAQRLHHEIDTITSLARHEATPSQMSRRILEGGLRPWKKWFGLKR